MLILDKDKLNFAIKRRGFSLNQLAVKSQVSRQSIYNMLKGGSVFNTTFEKIIDCLGVGYEDVTIGRNEYAAAVMKKAPKIIQSIALELSVFAEENNAAFFLFGSKARGETNNRADWDFGISKLGKKMRRKFIILKQALIEKAFPYRIDIVDMNQAPQWFIESIADDMIVLAGEYKFAAAKRRKQ